MSVRDYLVCCGINGDLGRYRPTQPIDLARDDRVVVRTSRGIEIGTVLRTAGPELAGYFSSSDDGPLLRRMSASDEIEQQLAQRLSRQLLARGQQLVDEWGIPLALLEAEVLLQRDRCILHQVRLADSDPQRLLDTLGQEFHIAVALFDLALPPQKKGGCGSCSSGGCGSCSSGGCGSGCGGCSRKKKAASAVPVSSLVSPRYSLL